MASEEEQKAFEAEANAAAIAMCQVIVEHVKLPEYLGFLVTTFVVTHEGVGADRVLRIHRSNAGNAPLAVVIPMLEEQLAGFKKKFAEEQAEQRKKLD